VIRCIGRAHEGDFGVGKLARDGGHHLVALSVRIENDRRRIAAESLVRECIDLKDSHAIPPMALLSLSGSFARLDMAGYTSSSLGVVL